MKLFLIVLGGRPQGAHIEQHDVVFAVGQSVTDAYPAIRKHWGHANPHIDSFVVIDEVDGYRVQIVEGGVRDAGGVRLFFINLGGYRPGDLEEYHKKFVIPARSLEEAKQIFKIDPFFTEGMKDPKARSHLDDKAELFGFDLDDTMVVEDHIETKYTIVLTPDSGAAFAHNAVTIGYQVLPKE